VCFCVSMCVCVCVCVFVCARDSERNREIKIERERGRERGREREREREKVETPTRTSPFGVNRRECGAMCSIVSRVLGLGYQVSVFGGSGSWFWVKGTVMGAAPHPKSGRRQRG